MTIDTQKDCPDVLHPDLQSRLARHPVSLLFLATTVVALYGGFLSNPLVFDDFSYFGWTIDDDLEPVPGFGLRWLSVSSYALVRALAGKELIWQRLTNLSLHIANVSLLAIFLLALFRSAAGAPLPPSTTDASRTPIAPAWFALFGALFFALHPASVYGVAYLAQRSTLMATFFALLTWWLFLEGVVREQRRWQLASCASYLLAVLCKEHSIMVPAVSLALLLLLRRPDKQICWQLAPAFLLYALIGLFTYAQIKSGGVVGRAYEPYGADLLKEFGIDPAQAHALSVLTQCILYFKYLGLWLVPNPGWMSINMVEPFARSLASPPHIVGVLAFVLYFVIATRLLLRRGTTGLLGFALLGPWLMFATELSTVRIQEILVLYRSYLWMPCLMAAVPFLFQKASPRVFLVLASAATLALIPASWNRLQTFSQPLLVWDDALRLAQGREISSRLGRMHYNRGVAHLTAKHYPEAIQDFDAGIRFLPNISLIYNDRAMAYLETARYQEALRDFDVAILLDPNYYDPYLGRAQVYEALGHRTAARADYARACHIGVERACSKIR